MTFRETIRRANLAVLDDGVVTLGETSILLRMVKPFALRGNPEAVKLMEMLNQARRDGVIEPEESAEIAYVLESLAKSELSLESYVRVIPDFPKPGVLFRDVTGILDTAEGFNLALDSIAEVLEGTPFDVVAAPESRGFIFGSAISARFRKAFVPIRKPGKLPRETVSETYDLEYGQATLHMHADALIPGERVVVVDDLLATGGTALASARLVERLGGEVVKMVFPIELEGFKARERLLRNYDVATLVKYPGK